MKVGVAIQVSKSLFNICTIKSTVRTIQLYIAGVVPVNFTTFVETMLLKVPWFTPGFSYCRWWGVECCMTASELTLPTCSGGLQSIGVLALAGQHLCGRSYLPSTAIACTDACFATACCGWPVHLNCHLCIYSRSLFQAFLRS